jgi:hypothetical protein
VGETGNTIKNLKGWEHILDFLCDFGRWVLGHRDTMDLQKPLDMGFNHTRAYTIAVQSFKVCDPSRNIVSDSALGQHDHDVA